MQAYKLFIKTLQYDYVIYIKSVLILLKLTTYNVLHIKWLNVYEYFVRVHPGVRLAFEP